jgi:diguanylate cyclase
MPLDVLASASGSPVAANEPSTPMSSASAVAWERVARTLGHGLQQALPAHDGANQELSRELGRLVERMQGDATALLADETDALVRKVERVLQHRHHLFDQLGKLCHELTSSLTDIAEDGSWVKGQCEAMRLKIEEGLSARGVRAVSDMLHHARKRQAEVRGEREKARDALKALITQMLAELGELGSKTGNFHESVGRYAEVIERSDSLESLTGVVREMVAESRAVQTLVQQTQERLQEEHSKATDLTQRVVELEDEMKRLSDEVSTDQLTQIANRRGLMQAFEIERARLERSGGELSIGLLDIDNFKRLNDELGHSAGDEALKSLAAVVSKTLRPTDRVARYGGEEFVVLLPQTPPSEGEQVLTRLQRSLTGGLFMHKDKQIFVTFSAGVTDYRLAERIEDSLERADQALYEAKRTGKNRTCIG